MQNGHPDSAPIRPLRRFHPAWIFSVVIHALLAIWIFSLPYRKPDVHPRVTSVNITFLPHEEPTPSPPVVQPEPTPVPAVPTPVVPAPPVAPTPAPVAEVPIPAPAENVAPPVKTVTPEPTPLSPDMVSEEERVRYEEGVLIKPLAQATPSPTSKPKSKSRNPYEVIVETPAPKPTEKAVAQATGPLTEEDRIQALLKRKKEGQVGTGLKENAKAVQSKFDNQLQRVQIKDLAAPIIEKMMNKPQEGVERAIRFGKEDPDVEREVFKHYGIRKATGVITKDEVKKSGFSSDVLVNGNAFRPVSEPGYYTAVVGMTEASFQKMGELERAWLIKNGYDPTVVKLERVEFGIVRIYGEWDLGVLDAKIKKPDAQAKK